MAQEEVEGYGELPAEHWDTGVVTLPAGVYYIMHPGELWAGHELLCNEEYFGDGYDEPDELSYFDAREEYSDWFNQRALLGIRCFIHQVREYPEPGYGHFAVQGLDDVWVDFFNGAIGIFPERLATLNMSSEECAERGVRVVFDAEFQCSARGDVFHFGHLVIDARAEKIDSNE